MVPEADIYVGTPETAMAVPNGCPAQPAGHRQHANKHSLLRWDATALRVTILTEIHVLRAFTSTLFGDRRKMLYGEFGTA